MSRKCKDPEIRNKLSLDIVFKGSLGEGVFLTPQYVKHLWECETCRNSLPLLFRKAESAQKDRIGFGILNRAEGGDPRILRKERHSGTLLFEPYEQDSSRGLMVIVTAGQGISYPEEITLDEFNRMK